MQNPSTGKTNHRSDSSASLNAQTPQVREPKVVIVGAGLAGLAAAARLHQLGLQNVIVLEAAERVGGRVHTIKHADYLLELGAQWLHGAHDNPLYQWLTDKDMLDDFEDASLGFQGLFCTNEGQQIEPRLVKRVIEILVHIKSSLFSQSRGRLNGSRSASCVFKDHLESVCSKDAELMSKRAQVEAIFEWFLRFESIENGCSSMDEVSVASYTDYTDWGDGTLLNFKLGYTSLLDYFCSQIPARGWIHLSKQVLSVEMLEQTTPSSSEGIWFDDRGNRHTRPMLVRYNCLDCSESKEPSKRATGDAFIECDHVIVTVSLGFLKRNHETFFRPPLPRTKRDLIESIGFGTVNKIVLQFEKPFWRPTDQGVKLVWNNHQSGLYPSWARDIISFDTVRRQPHLLIGWIGGQGARDMERETDENIADTCLRLLETFLPQSFNRPSKLVGCFCSRWHSNPFTCGSYSFQSMRSFNRNVDKLHEPLYNPASGGESNKLTASSPLRVPRLMFAGEATAGKLYSTTHGAIITGWREADRLMDSLSGFNKASMEQVGLRSMVPIESNQRMN